MIPSKDFTLGTSVTGYTGQLLRNVNESLSSIHNVASFYHHHHHHQFHDERVNQNTTYKCGGMTFKPKFARFASRNQWMINR